ncbi:MAG: hypothetical protein ACR2HA_00020 [Nocardioides sp.]
MHLPLRPDGHPSPRQLLALLEAHVGTARAAQLCADLLDDDPHEHAGLVVFLGGHAGRSILDDGTSWKPYWARVWGARGLLYVWDDRVIPAVLSGLRDDAWRVAEGCLRVCALRELPGGDDSAALTVHELPRVRAAALRSLGAAVTWSTPRSSRPVLTTSPRRYGAVRHVPSTGCDSGSTSRDRTALPGRRTVAADPPRRPSSDRRGHYPTSPC